MTVATRESPSFAKAVQAIRSAAEAKMGAGLDSEECALAFKGILTAEPVMPVLMRLTQKPGGPAARMALRRMAKAWSEDRPMGEAELAPLLKEIFHAACWHASTQSGPWWERRRTARRSRLMSA